jgi:hypothetical protein
MTPSASRQRTAASCAQQTAAVDVNPGRELSADCIKSHASEVSDGGEDAMAKAEAGKKRVHQRFSDPCL